MTDKEVTDEIAVFRWVVDKTKIVHARCPNFWANVKALIGIFRQSVGPSLAIWANLVQFSFKVYAAMIKAGTFNWNQVGSLTPRYGIPH
jgi:hypothetical protein